MRWETVVENLPLLLSGLLTTLLLLAGAVTFGFVLSIPLAIARCSRSAAISMPVWAFTYLIRGTPILVQLLFIYYGVAQIPVLRETWLWSLFSSASFCAMLAFVLNTAAYTTEIFAGSLRNFPSGEVEAARAIGMTSAMLYRRVLVPGFLRRSLPQYENEIIMVLHATSLASTVTLLDLTGAAQLINSRYYTSFEPLAAISVVYLALTLILTRGFRILEKRWCP